MNKIYLTDEQISLLKDIPKEIAINIRAYAGGECSLRYAVARIEYLIELKEKQTLLQKKS